MNNLGPTVREGFKISREKKIIDIQASSRRECRFKASPNVGVVVGTFASLPYVHLQLEARRRLYPEIPMLVHDDSSPKVTELEKLCVEYGVHFEWNVTRFPPMKGDLAAFYGGLLWAEEQGLDLLVKLSRRFVPICRWIDDLQKLAECSDYATYCAWTTSFNFGFRSECVGMAVNDWAKVRAQIAAEICAERSVFVEGFLHNLARFLARDNSVKAEKFDQRVGLRPPDKDGYAVWEFMGTDRKARSINFLWHNSCQPIEYAKLAKSWGLNYSEQDFRDPNMGYGAKP